MGICSDRSVNYLKSLNLNVVLHPLEDLEPLALLGEYKGARGIIGTLSQLTEEQDGNLPKITSGEAANINGQKSSKLPIELGLDILGNIIGAMGGNLGVKAAYERASKVEFSYAGVTRHRANTIEIGDYLEASKVRWDHPILKKYLFGKGRLYILTEIVTSKKLGVTAYNHDNSSIKLEVPVIKELVGGSLSVGKETETTTTVTYEGDKNLAFGFVAIELSAGDRGDDGEFDLVFRPVKAGTVSFGVGAGQGVVFADFEGALPELKTVDPAELGEGELIA
ncbi:MULTISPECIES: gasdermin [Sphingomonadales]|jgi:hypothetical protein|uniref:Gasdermin bGSDM n=2 Tax=Sphingomonadaceae TaxID=41297 RepID=A0A397P908_9SPHN|nr:MULTISPECIES: hypothetical protein [Sphingomonadaceae]EKU73298.1 hypothetical protein HMPREF9718_03767 [Sphingobium yanoikuyae ATCC 51230]NLS26515.1 hypothetical protein [Sphingomonas sp. S2M10]RIA46066.1 hypothetical protein DFR49_0595 [Hephaestia caeni]WQE08079.1 hypothetical protein U0025_04120 [Sphingobium yanoikuyae]